MPQFMITPEGRAAPTEEVLDALQREPLDFESLITATGLPREEVTKRLRIYLNQGLVKQVEGVHTERPGEVTEQDLAKFIIS